MEYISAEEFLNQPKEVQDVFWDWWMPSKGDINYSPVRNGIEVVEIENNSFQRRKNGYIPLFSEGQLRRFIEDKTDSKIIVQPSMEGKYHVGYDKYCEWSESGDYSGLVYCYDLLEAYWKVAVDIASREVEQ